MGLSCHSKSSRGCVAGIWFAASAMPFLRLRGFSQSRCRDRSHDSFPWLGFPSGFTIPRPLESCAVPMALMGFSFLSRYSFGSAVSRIPTLVPPLQDRNPADGVLFRTSDPKVETWTGGVALQSVSPAHSMHLSVPCPHAVSDIESFCSEDQRVTMPRGFRALFPARIRSRSRPKSDAGRCSHGLFRLVEILVLRLRLIRLPGSAMGYRTTILPQRFG
jgi:hypothetical protein